MNPATLTVAAFFVFAIGLYFRTQIIQGIAELRSRHWPVVEGRIESGDIRIRRGRGGGITDAIAHLAYSYEVAGKYYAGNFERRFGTEEEAQDFVDFLKGQIIEVRYQPNDPTTSVFTG
jgi:hypothetical protein